MFIKRIPLVIFIVILCIYSYMAVSLEQDELPQLTEYKNEISDNGYFFKFNTNDGNQREERGKLVQKGDKKILVVSGFYSYIGDDEQEYFTTYESDENGYRAETKISEPSVGIPSAALASLAGGGLG